MKSAISTTATLLAGGIAFVVLYPILGVTLWVSLFGAAGAIVLASLAAGIAIRGSSADEGGLSLNPIVDVEVLRVRYAATLCLALLAGFMVVQTFAFAGGTVQSIGFALGIALVAAGGAGLMLSLTRQGPKQRITSPALRVPVWDIIGALTTGIGAWQIVQTLVFSTGTSRWLTFANGCALVVFALIGLVMHELSTERVVHALELVGVAVDGDEAAERTATRIPAGAAH